MLIYNPLENMGVGTSAPVKLIEWQVVVITGMTEVKPFCQNADDLPALS